MKKEEGKGKREEGMGGGWPEGYFELFGRWHGEALERPEQGRFEQRDELGQVDWRAEDGENDLQCGDGGRDG